MLGRFEILEQRVAWHFTTVPRTKSYGYTAKCSNQNAYNAFWYVHLHFFFFFFPPVFDHIWTWRCILFTCKRTTIPVSLGKPRENTPMQIRVRCRIFVWCTYLTHFVLPDSRFVFVTANFLTIDRETSFQVFIFSPFFFSFLNVWSREFFLGRERKRESQCYTIT